MLKPNTSKLGVLKTILLTSSMVAGAAIIYPSAVSALGNVFFDDTGTGAGCDLRMPMTSFSDTEIGEPICNGAPVPNQDEPMLLWAGQNNNVSLPEDDQPAYKGMSQPFVKATAYFEIGAGIPRISDFSNPAIEYLDTSKMDAGDRVIEIVGAHLCAESMLGADRQDGARYGYYGVRPAAYAAVATRADPVSVTMYKIGDIERYGHIRSEEQHCGPGNNVRSVDLKNIDPKLIKKVQGLTNIWSVDIQVRHIDVSGPNPENNNYDRRKEFDNDINDGVENSFKLRQTCKRAESCRMIATRGTKAKEIETTFDTSEGYVATGMRGMNGQTRPDDGEQDTDALWKLNQRYSTITTRFGADCTVGPQPELDTIRKINTDATRYRMSFYDLDFTPNTDWPTRTKLRLHDYGDDGKKATPAQIESGDHDDMWLYPNPDRGNEAFPGGHLGNNGWWRKTPPRYDQLIAPPSLDNQYFIVTFPVLDDHDYEMQLVNVYDWRLSQWSVPFDGIWHESPGCQNDGRVEMVLNRPRYQPGDSFTATGKIHNDGAQVAQLREYGVTWYDDDGRNEDIGDGDPFAEVQIDRKPSTGWDNATIPKEQPPYDAYIANGITIPSNTAYKYICSRIVAESRRGVGDITQLVPAEQTKCAPITKAPSLSVDNGDIRAGGVYPALGETCTYGAGGTIAARGWIKGAEYGGLFASSRGSKSQFAAVASGPITLFGTRNSFTGIPESRALLFGSSNAYPTGTVSDNGLFYLEKSLAAASAYPAPTPTHCLMSGDAVVPEAVTSTVTEITDNDVTIVATDKSPKRIVFKNGTSKILMIEGKNMGYNDAQDIRVSAESCGAGAGTPRYKVMITPGATQGITGSSGGVLEITQIPRFNLAIVSPCIDLVVQDQVTRLYGIYNVRGDLLTCQGDTTEGFNGEPARGYTSTLTSNNCTNTLTVNGLMTVGERAHTYRTAGDGSMPAETFYLEPRVLMGEFGRGIDELELTTDSQMELPPRY